MRVEVSPLLFYLVDDILLIFKLKNLYESLLNDIMTENIRDV